MIIFKSTFLKILRQIKTHCNLLRNLCLISLPAVIAGRRRCAWWKETLFRVLKDENGAIIGSTCISCEREVMDRQRNGTCLARHLRRCTKTGSEVKALLPSEPIHIRPVSVENRSISSQEQSVTANKKSSMNGSMSNSKRSSSILFFDSCSAAETDRIHITILTFIYSNALPFSLVDTDGFFHKLLRMLRPTYIKWMPNRKQIGVFFLTNITQT